MRTTTMVVSIIAVLASAALAQTTAEQNTDHVFYFTHTDGAQNIHEIATVVRVMADLPKAAEDVSEKTLSVEGSASQLALAGWLFTELDKPIGDQPAQDPAIHEYRPAGGSDDVVRVFHVPYADTIQAFQEVATLVRSTAQIPRMFTYNAPRALVMRGTSSQAALSEWLLGALNVQAKDRAATHEFPMPGSRDDVARVYYLTNPGTLQSFQEIATVVRAISDLRFLFTYNDVKAIAWRGTSEQANLAIWLLHELDRPLNATLVAQQNPDAAANEYKVADREGVVHVYYLPDVPTVQRFQEIVTSVRTTTMIRRAFTYNAIKAVAFRGTADQIALVDRMIQEQAKP